jgi:pyrimidine-nucleoside phosphorylase
VSPVLHNEGPEDLKRLSIELAARMIFQAKVTGTLEEARDLALTKLVDGSAYKKFKEVVTAQGGDARALDKFELLPNATGERVINAPRSGYVSAIDAEDIGRAAMMIGAGRSTKEDSVDPAVGVILDVKVGEKVEAGAPVARVYHTREDNLDEAVELAEGAFRYSAQPPDPRDIILEVVG